MQYPFTVKIQEFNGGETVMPASVVEAIPQDQDKPSDMPAPVVSVLIHDAHTENPPEEVAYGAVFVMNELGKTVARYRLAQK